MNSKEVNSPGGEKFANINVAGGNVSRASGASVQFGVGNSQVLTTPQRAALK
jgi:hypothetical protein